MSTFIIAGLGNPGEEYENTRHNVGRIIVSALAAEFGLEWKQNKKPVSQSAKGKCGKGSVVLILPDTFMNNSGKAIAPLVKSVKAAEKLIVVHDDIDLPFGTTKIVFDRGSGGHNGVESVRRAVKTTAFVRLRIGVAPVTASGKVKKPDGEEAVIKFILGKFTPAQEKDFKKITKRGVEALMSIVNDGRERAMNVYNSN